MFNWNKIKTQFKLLIQFLQKFTERTWYPPLIGFLALIDVFVIIIPNDGLLISSAILNPKKWLSLALYVAIGSTLGSLFLGYLVSVHGLPWILNYYPGLTQSEIWQLTFNFFQSYGLLVVFAVALAPMPQQPVVILACLSNTSLWKLGAVMVLGRIMKYVFLAYLASHAPRLLNKLWGVENELREVGVKVD